MKIIQELKDHLNLMFTGKFLIWIVLNRYKLVVICNFRIILIYLSEGMEIKFGYKLCIK